MAAVHSSLPLVFLLLLSSTASSLASSAFLCSEKDTTTLLKIKKYFVAIWHCPFLCQIPRSLNDIKFDTINLAGNRLTGDASFLLGTLRTTKHIDLSRNELEFDLSSVKFPHSLRSLSISHNRITGRIPKQITKLFALSDLDVSYNELCRPIPSGGSMSHLYQPSFEHNKCLCGAPLPPCNGTAGNKITKGP